MNPGGDWLWYLGAGVGGSCGVLVLVWALLADRSRARRCPRCWYDMGGVSGLRCPECGREARDEKGLHRRRRRRTVALPAAVVAVAAAGVALAPAVSRGEHWAWVPNGLLIRSRPLAEWMPEPARLLYAEELRSRTLTFAQYDLLVWQAAGIYLKPDAKPRDFSSPVTRIWYQTNLHHVKGRQIVPGREEHLRIFGPPRSEGRYSALSAATARRLADGLLYLWRSDPWGEIWHIELEELTETNPAAAEYMLDRVFAEPVEWAICLPHPTAGKGGAMKRYRAALDGTDEVARSRAATCLLLHHSPTISLRGWVDPYSGREELWKLADPAGNALLKEALGGDMAVIARLELFDLMMVFPAQLAELHRQAPILDYEDEWRVNRLVNMRQK